MVLGLDVALGIAGIAFSIPGYLDVNARLTNLLLQRLQKYGDDYKKLVELIIRLNKSQTQELFLFIHESSNAIPEELTNELLDLFQALRNIFEELLRLFPDTGAAIDRSQNKALKISAETKRKADDAVRRLEEWNDRFFKRAVVFILFGQRLKRDISDPSGGSTDENHGLVAVRRVQQLRGAIDESLGNTSKASKLLLTPSEVPKERERLNRSSLWMSRTESNTSSSPMLIEYRKYSDDASQRDIANHRRTARDIACILHEAEPCLTGILHCKGFLFDSLENRFELHFPYPDGYEKPRSLLDILCDPINRERGIIHPLNQRIDLAKSIVSAVFLLHAADFVHKQIRSDNIIIFERRPEDPVRVESIGRTSTDSAQQHRQWYPYRLGRPFLVGFDSSRKADAHSLMVKVEEWRKSIYLCPERHRLQPGDEFRMEHDIYSLGVVLLEVGMWASFCDRQSPQLGKRVWRDQTTLKGSEELKKIYMGLAIGTVPRLMGQKYADIVVACLSEFHEERRKGEFDDADGIVIGTAYITKVIGKLEEISM